MATPPVSMTNPPPARKYDWPAALLSYLLPGLGQVLQGRVGKGVMFFVCLYGLFFYGLWMGRMKNVFVPEPRVPRVTLGQAATVFTDAGGEGLPAGEGEQPADERPGAVGGLQRPLDQPLLARSAEAAALEDVEAADDRRQEVVEVVGDAAGQLAQRLHLLRLAKLCLGLGEA